MAFLHLQLLQDLLWIMPWPQGNIYMKPWKPQVCRSAVQSAELEARPPVLLNRVEALSQWGYDIRCTNIHRLGCYVYVIFLKKYGICGQSDLCVGKWWYCMHTSKMTTKYEGEHGNRTSKPGVHSLRTKL